MKFATLSDGQKVPMLGLGTWKSNEGDALRAITNALEIGYRHIDCAARYENEPEIGEAIATSMAAHQISRNDLWVTSKLWNSFHQAAHVEPALKRTLSDLKLDYLDLYLMHWPVALKPEVPFPAKGEDFMSLEQVPIIETWQAMEACVDKGLVRYIGVSNFSQKKISDLLGKCSIRPINNQVEAHPFLQQKELLQYCSSEGITLTAYSPLGSKDRPARLIRDEEPSLLDHPVVHEIANAQGVTPAQILIAWAINRGSMVIPKSSNPARLRENFQAADLELPCDAMDRLAELDRHYRYIDGSIWVMDKSPYTIAELWDE